MARDFHVQFFFAVTLLFCLILQCIALDEPGVVIVDRRNIKEGESVNITCRINPAVFLNLTSKHLTFEGSISGQVPKNDIKIINETSIVYTIHNATLQDQYYRCMAGIWGVNEAHLSVGYPPQSIKDFGCTSYDFRFMVCKFTVPNNTVSTTYALSYTPQTPNYLQPCELERNMDQMVCNLTFEKGNYRQHYDIFKFTLVGKNDLGENIQPFTINHYENVVPLPPQFKIANISETSAFLQWEFIMFSYYRGQLRLCEKGQCKTYDKGIEYQVFLRSAYFPWLDFTNNTEKVPLKSGSIFRIALKNLPYAFTEYEVSVRLRVTLENNDKLYMQDKINWGEAFTDLFKTLGRLPEGPPKTDIGSFYIDTTETKVRLYWEHLQVFHYNGPDFHYKITEIRINGIPLDAKTLNKTANALFTYAWQRQNVYEYFIKSRNAYGFSESSYIKVPKIPMEMETTHSPEWIRAIYHSSNHSYTLSWIPPTNQKDLQNYTIFWCKKENVLQNDCKDTVHFANVDKNVTEYSKSILDANYTLTFAVSANYVNFSTGLHWTMCPAEDTAPLGKMLPDIGSGISSTSIEIKWSLDNICSSLPEGFTLIFCEIGSEQTMPCINEKITIIIDKTQRRIVLKELKPYTFYKIEMFMFSRLKNGTLSDAQFIKTKEDAPSPPHTLQIDNVTSSSISLSWYPPKHPNGIIRNYTIDFNNEKRIVKCFSSMDKPCKYKLVNLTSFVEYKIFVKAFTIAFSGPSNDVRIHTLVGIPSSPRYMAENEKNRTILQWWRPQIPAGRNDFYEVAVTSWHKDKIKRRRITAVYGSQACAIKAPVCSNADDKLTLEVRAINVAKRKDEVDYDLYSTIYKDEDVDANYYQDNEDLECVGVNMSKEIQETTVAEYRQQNAYVLYKSAWEKGTEYGCGDMPQIHIMAAVALIIVLTSLTAMTTFYFARVQYKKWQITVILPGVLDVTGQGKPLGGGGSIDSTQKSNINTSGMDYHHLSKESLFQPESHRLLSSPSLDNGYLGSTSTTVEHLPACSIVSSGYDGSHNSCDYTPQEALTSLMSDGTSSAETTNTPIEEVGYKLMAHTTSAENNSSDGYIPAQNVLGENSSSFLPYVKPNNGFFWQKPMPATTHYVPPHLLQKSINAKLPNYTSLQTVNKTITPQPIQPISGYVTHKQLSAFGQQQQQQQQQQQKNQNINY